MSDDSRRPEPNTVPPPHGAKDMYSAPTRVGTLPEELLEALRDQQAAQGSLEASAQRAPANAPFGLPPQAFPSEPPTRPAVRATLPLEALDPRAGTSLLVVPPADDLLAELAPDEPLSPELLIDEDLPPARSGLARSLVIVAIFAVLGALAAAAITFW